MTPEQYKKSASSRVIKREFKNRGWHFCPRHDLLLVGPGMPEFVTCHCEIKRKLDVIKTEEVL
jgi:hypothetical protein